MRSFIGYYKWHLIFLLIVIVCFVFIFVNMTTTVKPDVTVGYIGINYVNVQTFNDNKYELELLLRDANDDNQKIAEMYAYSVDLQNDIDDLLIDMADAESYDVVITTKEALKNFKDKKVFVTANEYVNLSNKDLKTLKDKSDRIYAVSLEDNDYVKKMGILNTEGLYLAVFDAEKDKNGDIPMTRKNGRNISGYILGEE